MPWAERQRAWAATAVTRPLASSTTGWCSSANSPSCRAARSRVGQLGAGVPTSACIWGAYSSTRPLPAALARYIARSALRIRSPGLMPGSAKATPMEAATRTSLPSTRYGWERVIRSRSAISWIWYSRALRSRAAVADDEGGELVAAEPGGGVPGADRVLEPAGGLDEQLVAGLVADGVVDRLEAVEVDEEHGGAAVAGAAAGERLADALGEQRAVGQVGERVVLGVVLQLGLEPDPFGDVPAVEDQAALVAVDGGLDVEPVAAAPDLKRHSMRVVGSSAGGRRGSGAPRGPRGPGPRGG